MPEWGGFGHVVHGAVRPRPHGGGYSRPFGDILSLRLWFVDETSDEQPATDPSSVEQPSGASHTPGFRGSLGWCTGGSTHSRAPTDGSDVCLSACATAGVVQCSTRITQTVFRHIARFVHGPLDIRDLYSRLADLVRSGRLVHPPIRSDWSGGRLRRPAGFRRLHALRPGDQPEALREKIWESLNWGGEPSHAGPTAIRQARLVRPRDRDGSQEQGKREKCARSKPRPKANLRRL